MFRDIAVLMSTDKMAEMRDAIRALNESAKRGSGAFNDFEQARRLWDGTPVYIVDGLLPPNSIGLMSPPPAIAVEPPDFAFDKLGNQHFHLRASMLAMPMSYAWLTTAAADAPLPLAMRIRYRKRQAKKMRRARIKADNARRAAKGTR